MTEKKSGCTVPIAKIEKQESQKEQVEAKSSQRRRVK